MTRRPRLLWSLLGLSLVTFALTVADACAPVMRDGEFVGINTERALIVWDPETTTEHFIRSAQFVTEAADFGFLVPTPSEPSLSETDAAIFGALAARTAPRYIRTSEKKSIFRLFEADAEPTTDASPAPSGAMMDNSVEVLQQKQVAGYDAAVLKANDAQALNKWLEENGYVTRPALAEWLKQYVEQQWVITAFKLSQTVPNGRRILAQPVRLSFKTERPFYPYREPADMRGDAVREKGGSRTLRVFFLSDRRYDASVGDSGTSPATVKWANTVDTDLLGPIERGTKLLPEELGLEDSTTFLTEFEDSSFPRPGTDELYFSVAASQEHVERPPIRDHRVVKEYWPNLPQWTIWLTIIPLSVPALVLVYVKRRKASAITGG